MPSPGNSLSSIETRLMSTTNPRAVPLRPMADGTPIEIIFFIQLTSGFKSDSFSFIPTLPENRRYIPMIATSPLVISVVNAAPTTPIRGMPPQPNTKKGSNAVSRTLDVIVKIIGVFVSP